MKLLAVVFALFLGFQDVISENEDCYVAAVCQSSELFNSPVWMRYSLSTCETNNISKKGVKGELGPKGEDGPKGETGLAGPKGGNGTKGQKREKGGIGPIGENGTKGEMGSKGEQGSVDSLILQNIIDVICPLKYNNKCFFPVTANANHTEGVVLCQQLGGNLANIYDQIHMDKVMSYIRNHTLVDYGRWLEFHLGMTYDLKNNKIMLRDGSAAPAGLKWYRDNPKIEADRTSMYLHVRKDGTSPYQYLFNSYPSVKRNTLCEI